MWFDRFWNFQERFEIGVFYIIPFGLPQGLRFESEESNMWLLKIFSL
jgi:hypothetical protein